MSTVQYLYNTLNSALDGSFAKVIFAPHVPKWLQLAVPLQPTGLRLTQLVPFGFEPLIMSKLIYSGVL